jgi:hypothetical protein
MSITIPRAEIHAIAARYDDAFSLATDPSAEYVRHVAQDYRVMAGNVGHPGTLLAEADELDALVDRIEREAAA